jgi:hypothetical protein
MLGDLGRIGLPQRIGNFIVSMSLLLFADPARLIITDFLLTFIVPTGTASSFSPRSRSG